MKKGILRATMGAVLSLGLAFGVNGADQKQQTIGVSVLTMTNPFFKEIADNIQAEAKKDGYNVIIVSSELDPAKQNDQINDFIAKQVSAIVLNPADSKSVGESIKHANKAGIPVFTCDIACMDPSAKVVSHIATDNYEGGCMAADTMMKVLGNKGKIVLVTHPTVESGIMRMNGFKDTLKKANSPIQIVAETPSYGDKANAFAAMQDVLQAHPDINGVFAVNDPTAIGVIAALEKANKKEVIVIGFDGSQEGKQAVKDGKMYATVCQSTTAIGNGVVDVIAKYFDGDDIKPVTLIPTTVYTKEDAVKGSSK
ncbi:MAG: substrate-binding domain-containing protein [Lentisphaerota bacterium]